MRKYYTIAEAEEKILMLRPRIANLIKLSRAIDFLESVEIQYDDEYETIRQDLLMNKKFHRFSLNFCREIEKLLKEGIVLKDIDGGIVNFFSLHEGKEIFLCWRISEDKIDSWYEIGSEYEMRRPAAELKKRI